MLEGSPSHRQGWKEKSREVRRNGGEEDKWLSWVCIPESSSS